MRYEGELVVVAEETSPLTSAVGSEGAIRDNGLESAKNESLSNAVDVAVTASGADATNGVAGRKESG